jgi:hypothetical protein
MMIADGNLEAIRQHVAGKSLAVKEENGYFVVYKPT